MIGGNMPLSAGCYCTFLHQAKQATKKLASGWWNPRQTVKTRTTLQHCTRCSYALVLVQIWCILSIVLTGFLFLYWLSSTNLCCLSSGSKTPQGQSNMRRLLRPVRVQLRQKYAGVIWLLITLSGCVSSTEKIDFCCSLMSCRHTVCLSLLLIP